MSASPSLVGIRMPAEDEPSLIQSPRKRVRKAVETPPDETQTAPDAVPDTPPVEPPPPVEKPLRIVADESHDEMGFKTGDDVWFWTADNSNILNPKLKPLLAFLGVHLGNGAWDGTRMESVAQGHYKIHVMRFADQPTNGFFTRRG